MSRKSRSGNLKGLTNKKTRTMRKEVEKVTLTEPKTTIPETTTITTTRLQLPTTTRLIITTPTSTIRTILTTTATITITIKMDIWLTKTTTKSIRRSSNSKFMWLKNLPKTNGTCRLKSSSLRRRPMARISRLQNEFLL